jgi:S1-C subfamily serine protease
MRRPPARRPRLLAVALLSGLTACAEDGPSVRPVVVTVAAQPCDRPNRSRGVGVVVADGVVATAGHTVEGALRELTVDGTPAQVIAVDPRTDLALLANETAIQPAELSPIPTERAHLVGPGGATQVTIVGTGPLVVDDTTDRRRYVRQVHTFEPGVSDGTSGAPLVDDRNRVIGVVVLSGSGVAYASTAGELTALLERTRDQSPTISGVCLN